MVPAKSHPEPTVGLTDRFPVPRRMNSYTVVVFRPRLFSAPCLTNELMGMLMGLVILMMTYNGNRNTIMGSQHTILRIPVPSCAGAKDVSTSALDTLPAIARARDAAWQSSQQRRDALRRGASGAALSVACRRDKRAECACARGPLMRPSKQQRSRAAPPRPCRGAVATCAQKRRRT